MLPDLVVAVVVVALDGRVLDGAVGPFDPGLHGAGFGYWSTMLRLGELMLDGVLGAGRLERVTTEEL